MRQLERPAALAASRDSIVLWMAVGGEILAWLILATLGVAGLEGVTPAARLGILYLLAVLAVAIRRGQVAALLTAVLGVLTFNYLFITPRHRLAIAHSQDVVELIVLLIAAVVVGRLAALGRQRAGEAEVRARDAATRQREAQLLAQAASAILAGQSVNSPLEVIGRRVAAATGASHARIVLDVVPSPGPDELTIALSGGTNRSWLHLAGDTSWTRPELDRIAEPLGKLVAVAIERDRMAESAAESEAARRAEVAKTAILRAISHDLRSPLTAISTAGSALRATQVTDTERGELIDAIEEESARLARLVDDLLDLSRIESGAVAPQADWCDLHDVVGTAIVQARADERIEVRLPPELPLVRADAAQLERVFSNLIDNALKFSAPQPIRITGGAAGGRVTVRVTDSGPGIARGDRAHVFEPFFRGRGARGGGSGLGLAICRGFVEANGGQIVLQTGAGRGNSFAVSLPAADPHAGGDSADGSAASSLASARRAAG